MLHLTFRVRRDRALAKLSLRHPGTRQVVWCNLQTDIVEVQADDPAKAEALTRELIAGHDARPLGAAASGRSRSVAVTWPRPAASLAVACEGLPRRSLSLCIEQHGGIVLPPIVIEDGWETFRAALFDEAKAQAFLAALKDFGPHEVLSKRRFQEPFIQEEFMLSTAELLGGLTRKQAEALLQALQGGYYAVPRTATMVEIAKRRGQPRTTMEEHVRKAEAKVLTAMGPFLALRLHTRPEGKVAPRRRPRTRTRTRARA